jgi:hypothetical protein
LGKEYPLCINNRPLSCAQWMKRELFHRDFALNVWIGGVNWKQWQYFFYVPRLLSTYTRTPIQGFFRELRIWTPKWRQF